MYKAILCILLVTAFSFVVKGQDYPQGRRLPEIREQKIKARPYNIIKSNFVPLLISQNPLTAELRIIYERLVADKQSSFVGLSYVYPNSFFLDTLQYYRNLSGEDIRMRGFRVQVGHKFYLLKSKEAPEGLYIGPHVSYNQSKIFIKSYYPDQVFTKIIFFNVNMHIGYQIIAAKVFPMDFTTGFGYRHNYFIDGDISPVIETRETINKGLKLSLFFNFGFAF